MFKLMLMIIHLAMLGQKILAGLVLRIPLEVVLIMELISIQAQEIYLAMLGQKILAGLVLIDQTQAILQKIHLKMELQ